MPENSFKLVSLLLSILLATLAHPAAAQTDVAKAAMRDPANPLLLMRTSAGDLYLELFTDEAPRNSQRVLALATGEFTLQNPTTDAEFQPRYYNGQHFFLGQPDSFVQFGSPLLHPLGGPPQQDDEINADALGLANQPALLADGSLNPALNINDSSSLSSELLVPLYQRLGIVDVDELEGRQEAIYQQLREMSVKDVLQLQGYRFRDDLRSSPVLVGSLFMANQGPDSNTAELIISLSDAPWLSGRHTVIGQVVFGLETVRGIAASLPSPQSLSSLSPVIYSVDLLD